MVARVVVFFVILTIAVSSCASSSRPLADSTAVSAPGDSVDPASAAEAVSPEATPATEDTAPVDDTGGIAAPDDTFSADDTAPPNGIVPTEDTLAADSAAVLRSGCRGDGEGIMGGRTDVNPTGNRVAPGGIDLLEAPMATVYLQASPTWIVPFIDPEDPCQAKWYVTLEDGQAVAVDGDGLITDAGPAVTPPESAPGVITSAHDDLDQFENPLPDSRVVTFLNWTAALVEPTDRYGHGVLGDRIEAGGVEIIDTATGERTRIIIDEPSVIEGISPMLLNVDAIDDDVADVVPEVLVTLSNSDDGAWLALYNIDGTLRAQSEPIGRGNRWRNQLGAAQTGSGNYEIVDVRTPHLDGVVEFFRVDGDRLERVATTSGYTSHTIGSRNLDMGILLDADVDKLTEVVLPTRDLGSLAVIDRDGDDAIELGRIDLGASLNTNIATQWLRGQAWVAVGTTDGRLLIFGDPDYGS